MNDTTDKAMACLETVNTGVRGGFVQLPGHDGYAPPRQSRKKRTRAGQVCLRRHVRERVHAERLDQGRGHGAFQLYVLGVVDSAFESDLPHGRRLVCGEFGEVREL